MDTSFVRNLIGIGKVVSYDKEEMTNEGALIVQVELNGSIEDVIIFNEWGSSGVPYIVGSECITYSISALAEVKFGHIRNELYQPKGLQEGDKVIYNKDGEIRLGYDGKLTITNKDSTIILDLDNNIDITSTANVNINGSLVNLGSAVDLVLNKSAAMEVVIASGSSAGTYPVTIISSGQNKVKA